MLHARLTRGRCTNTKGAEGGMYKMATNACTGWHVCVRASTAIIIPYHRQTSE